MYQTIKDEMKEIISIVNDCPENLREKCFEVMLNHLLSEVALTKPKIMHQELAVGQVYEMPKSVEETIKEDKSAEELEVQFKDFHMKIRKFMQVNGITEEDLNNIYYKSGEKILPLYDDLKTNKMAECQMRITLLTAFENSGTNDGDLITDGEVVRAKCQELKCYDTANFAANFKKNAMIFDDLEKYEKGKLIKISAEGKKELAKVLLELSRGV